MIFVYFECLYCNTVVEEEEEKSGVSSRFLVLGMPRVGGEKLGGEDPIFCMELSATSTK